MIETKKLNKEISLKDFKLIQIWRENDLAIYEQTGHNRSVLPAKQRYEVIIIEVAPASNIKGVIIPERELYPKIEDWGLKGWTTISMGSANKIIKDIKERRYLIANLII